jgi:PPM family protein phosphatase
MVRFAAQSHVGNRSGENEDVVGWSELDHVWFVADGMGGHAAGQIASGIVKNVVLDHSREEDLAAVALKAHEAVLTAAADHDEWRGMGSTLVAARVAKRVCTVFWVGDSRAYLWRRGELSHLTRDHSFLERLRAEGLLSEAEIQSDPRRNQITQGLGQGSPIPSRTDTPLRQGDRILLCSDGLNDEMTDQSICSVMAAHDEPGAAVTALIEAALENGGHDNVSVIVVNYDGPSSVGSFFDLYRRTRDLLSILAGIAAAALIIWVWRHFSRP